MSNKTQEVSVKKEGFAFGKENYILMIVGIIVILIGNLLMIGGGSEDPNVFNPEIFNSRTINTHF